jgi:hypothetical protein
MSANGRGLENLPLDAARSVKVHGGAFDTFNGVLDWDDRDFVAPTNKGLLDPNDKDFCWGLI